MLIKYELDEKRTLITPCPFNEKVKLTNGEKILINVASMFCSECKYYIKDNGKEVECKKKE
jgi:hypothetical protein